LYHPKPAPEWHGKAWLAASLLTVIVFVVGIPVGLFVWGIPWLAGYAAGAVPVEWERELGKQALESLAPPSQRCQPSPELDSLTRRLLAAEPSNPYPMEVRLVNTPLVNAFAAPGGAVVVHAGLLDKMRSPDELAAVLAHEFQHVLRRHSTRAVFRGLAWTGLAWFLLGDTSGLLAYATDTLGSLKYQRSDEEEADLRGQAMMQRAGLDPRAMTAMLEALQDQADIPAFLSTHPATGERLRILRARTQPTATAARPALSAEEWTLLRSRCRTGI
jgi:predicted Zn-dependent protease